MNHEPRRRGLRTGGKVIVAGMAAVVFGGTAYGYSTLASLNDVARTDVIGGGGEQGSDGAIDVLLVGRDARKDAQGNPLPEEVLRQLRAGGNGDDLTDTLIVLRIPNDHRSVKAFSVPRDSYVDLPDNLGKSKINGAFGLEKLAETKRLKQQGVTDQEKIDADSLTAARRATRQAVEDISGVKIDHYAEVNLLSFYDISKAVGGVQVCLRKATKDKNSGANFKAGQQKISGADALAFVRQRDNLPLGDLDRVKRQQTFLASLAKQVLSSGTMTDPTKLSDLIDAVKKSVVLDGNWDILDFVQQMQGLSGGAIQFNTVPVENMDYRYDPADQRKTAIKVDPDKIKAFASQLIGAAPAPSGQPSSDAAGSPGSSAPDPNAKGTVDIYNSTGRDGLAGRVAESLKSSGYAPGTTANAPSRRTSLVRYGSGGADAGKEVASVLGGLDVEQSSAVPEGHVEVFLGRVYSGPGAEGSPAGGGGAPAAPAMGPLSPVLRQADDQPITPDSGECIN